MSETLAPDRREIPEFISTPKTLNVNEQMPEVDQREIAEHIPVPGQKTSDTLWLIVIITLALILLGSFLTLAVSVFVSLPTSDGRQIIVTIFTTITSFLAGLFVTSPLQAMGKKD
jgi:hypothetical protein